MFRAPRHLRLDENPFRAVTNSSHLTSAFVLVSCDFVSYLFHKLNVFERRDNGICIQIFGYIDEAAIIGSSLVVIARLNYETILYSRASGQNHTFSELNGRPSRTGSLCIKQHMFEVSSHLTTSMAGTRHHPRCSG
jgi:hypothetical protein